MKTIRIPVHGLVEIPEICMKIIDTPEFQRLRSLKQCGTVEYVYTGASHTRLEHSIGVCYLGGLMAKSLRDKHPEYNITPEEILQVQIYGLVHDLGHGPFSHTFERFNKNFDHEKMSEEMFKLLLKNIGMTDAITDGVYKIPVNINKFKKSFLHDIISNDNDGVDVDKMDYIIRDSSAVNLAVKCDIHRIINNVRIVNNKLAYPIKLSFDLLDLFQTRFHLHRIVYQHRVVSAIECMLIQAMIYADPILKFSDAVYSADAMSTMTDYTIFEKIISFRTNNNELTNNELLMKNNELLKAKKMIKRIQYRELFKIVAVFVGKEDMDDESIKSAVLSGVNMSTEIFINRMVVNYSKDDKNPLDKIIFINEKYNITGRANDITGSANDITGRANDIEPIPNLIKELCPHKFGYNGIRVYADPYDPEFEKLAEKWSHTLRNNSEFIS